MYIGNIILLLTLYTFKPIKIYFVQNKGFYYKMLKNVLFFV
jgi:hypothetical protein